jgi:hypothetical protein
MYFDLSIAPKTITIKCFIEKSPPSKKEVCQTARHKPPAILNK